MDTAFVADSDDESECNTYSPPPAAQAEELPSFASTTSEPVSMTTSSTDPVFFQDVYNEQQIAAAREQQIRLTKGANTSLQLTAPTGTERTDPVSLPSQYPEGTDSSSVNASHAVKSAIMREKRMRQDAIEVADPYAFPSSAEEDQSPGLHRPSWMMDNGSSAAYRGAKGVTVDEAEVSGAPSRKRQRLSELRTDAVDSSLPPTAPPIYSSLPPTMPPVGIDKTVSSTTSEVPSYNLVPTIDIGDDPALIIHPRGLTNGQKEQYLAVELGVPGNLEHQREMRAQSNQLPPQSSARSEHQKTPSKTSAQSTPKATEQRAKSPSGQDVLEVTEHSVLEKTQDKPYTATPRDRRDKRRGRNNAPPAKETEPEHDGSEVQLVPAPATKKQRGRPKKAEKRITRATGAHLKVTEPQSAESVTKKRGRPKKCEAVVLETTQEEEVTQEAADVASAKVPEEDEAKDEMNNANNTTNTKMQDPTVRKVKTDGEDTPNAPNVTSKETLPKEPEKRIAILQKGSAGKPLYRIGLSKRSRIAPLLKSLPN
ncbi:hypothetical protein V2A60_009752 [Cordyceps javanica]